MQILGISNFYPTAPTTAPTSLSAIPTNTNVAISFTAPTNDGGMPITNYEYSFNNSSWTALSPADATSPVTVSGLTQNTAYTIYLRAVNGIGSGPGSSGVSFTTEGVPTGTPTITSIPVGTTTATVNFTYPGGGGAVTGYDLYVANQTNSWNNASASPISVTGLTPNVTYTFYVRAKNAYGVGPQSAGVNATTNPVFMSATGGSTNDYAASGFTYRAHTFTSSGTFTVNTVGSFGTVEYLVIAGGGGGGKRYNPGGGGGAGGYRTSVSGQTSGRGSGTESVMSLGAGSYTVTVGGGGTGGNSLPVFVGTNGGNSAFHTITSIGGGAGEYANSGGSGGGASVFGGSSSGPGAGTAGQGGDGGNNSGYLAGGGGAASGNAGAGNGASGLANPINGTSVTRAGGGGGGNYYATPGSGGSGGGGNGDGYSNRAGDGAGSTGSGGGGGFVNAGYSDRQAGNGGSGIVIVRYRIA